jgi:UDP-N-acetylmuramoylalanine--D-glutamate ligase
MSFLRSTYRCMKLSKFYGKTVIVFGYGIDGRSVVKVLEDQEDIDLLIVDEKKIEDKRYLSLDDSMERLNDQVIVVKSPGIPLHHPFLQACEKRGVMITTSMNIFFSERKGRGSIVGITGTKGKSTTASLLAHVIKTLGGSVQLIGNIGEPAMAHLEDSDETIFVVELSSYQLSDLQTAPDVAVMLNLFEEHMDYHGSVSAYYEAKVRITQLQRSDEICFYNSNDERLANMMKESDAICEPFPEVAKAIAQHTPLKGDHLAQNARAVVSVGRHFGYEDEEILKAMESFQSLPHRLEEVKDDSGILFVDDSISTTPESALAAIDTYEEGLKAIILGGYDRGYDFSQLANRLSLMPEVRCYALPGANRLKESLEFAGVDIYERESFKEIVDDVRKSLVSGDVCLLSPASPSYDRFTNFQERGEVFKRAIFSKESF